MNELSRRDFLKSVLAATAGALLTSDLPKWIDTIKDEELEELVKICEKFLSKDQILDILDAELDAQDALGLCFTYLIECGEEPEDFLILQGFLQSNNCDEILTPITLN